jgi:DeoR family suf operon transcriptional repressor
MQETRQHILEILREHGEATVDDIVAHLQARMGKITAVTVRHHLNTLHEDDLITSPQIRHRSTPGRPQHVYRLTEKGRAFFPNNYRSLAQNLMEQLRTQLPPQSVNVILEGVASTMAQEAQIPDVPLPERLDCVADYLNSRGYSAYWVKHENGYLLHTENCPYHQIANKGSDLCEMDMRLIALLLKAVPRRVSHAVEGDSSCSYLIPEALAE